MIVIVILILIVIVIDIVTDIVILLGCSYIRTPTHKIETHLSLERSRHVITTVARSNNSLNISTEL